MNQLFLSRLKICIITVVYNAASELKNTINSVKLQTYKNIEYIVIDGGSKDNTIDVIKSNEDIIDKWISEPDKGIYDAMNKGVKISSGDYIIFMNAGDTFFNEDSLANAFSQCNNKTYDVIYGDYNVINAYRRNGFRKAIGINELWKGMPTSHQAILFKRRSKIQVEYDLSSGLAADHNLLVRKYVANESFLKLTDVTIANYSGGGVSDSKRSEVYLSTYNNSLLLNKNKFLIRSYFLLMQARTKLRSVILSFITK